MDAVDICGKEFAEGSGEKKMTEGKRALPRNGVLPDLFSVAGGTAAGAIDLQAERGVAGTLYRINVGRVQHGGLLRCAELFHRSEHEAAP